jgi:hypothetical protein
MAAVNVVPGAIVLAALLVPHEALALEIKRLRREARIEYLARVK